MTKKVVPLAEVAARRALSSKRLQGLTRDAKDKIRGRHTYGTKSLMLRISRLDKDGDDDVDLAELEAQAEAINSMCETILTTWTNSGVISALFLSLTVSYLTGGPIVPHESLADANIDDQPLQLAFAILMVISVGASVLSVILALIMYVRLTVHMVDLEDKVWFLAKTKFRLPEYTMALAILSLTLATLPGMILSFGLSVGGTMCGIVALFFLLLLFFGISDRQKTHNYLKEKFDGEISATR